MLLQVVVSLGSVIAAHEQAFFIFLVISLALYKLAIYPFFISPLKNIPGPYVNRISKIPFWYHMWSGQLLANTHKWHELYGDVVILSPGQVSCNDDPKFLKDIYTKNMPKSEYYANYTNHGGRQNIFTSLDTSSHLKMKKMVLGLYQKSAVLTQNNRDFLVKKMTQLISIVDSYAVAHKSIDVLSLFGALAMDVVTAFELGKENASDVLLNSQVHNIIDTFRHRTDMNFWTTQFPSLWGWAAGKKFSKEAELVDQWQLDLYGAAEERAKRGEKTPSSTLETFRGHGVTGYNAYSSLSDHIVAGHETTATTLTYVFYQLSRKVNQGRRQRLLQELENAFGMFSSVNGSHVLADYDSLDRLPYLSAIVEETLRLHSAIPGAEPRICDQPYVVQVGKKLVTVPKGTEVSVQPYLMHRNEKLFVNAYQWEPERWILGEGASLEEELREMRRHMIPFGKGIRMCLGMHLAMAEIKLAVANLYWRYSTSIDKDWCQECGQLEFRVGENIMLEKESFEKEQSDAVKMAMTDAYTIRPVGDECFLQFSGI